VGQIRELVVAALRDAGGKIATDADLGNILAEPDQSRQHLLFQQEHRHQTKDETDHYSGAHEKDLGARCLSVNAARHANAENNRGLTIDALNQLVARNVGGIKSFDESRF
jgi:hypothetical protein